ncbi:MAG: hypothetical protein WA655_05750 [Candidatus Korobacteraceae bacterium]
MFEIRAGTLKEKTPRSRNPRDLGHPAKKGDRLGKNDKEEHDIISSYIDLGRKLGARQIVFATSSQQWHANTIEQLQKAFDDEFLHLTVLTRAELYS